MGRPSPELTYHPYCEVVEVFSAAARYPELEEVLIGMAPPFKKLRNPLLRRSVARVASLRQASAVGGIDLETMLNDLRKAVGQETIALGTEERDDAAVDHYFGAKPTWVDAKTVACVVDEREIPPDTMPLNPLMRAATRLEPGQMLDLVTTFLPAPGIDLIKRKGYRVWSVRQDRVIHTYVSRGDVG